MHLTITAPLTLRHLVSLKVYDMLPVPMAHSKPSTCPTLWRRFIKLGGRVLPISHADTQLVREYMEKHGTEAISEDGTTAYTLNGDFLAECTPQACGAFAELELQAA